MKNSRIWRASLIGAMLALLAAIPAVASADSSVKYEAGGSILYAGPSQFLPFVSPGLAAVVGTVPATDTMSEFKYHRDGSIKQVEVTTTNELVVGILGAAVCDPADTFCADLPGSFAVSLHESEVKVKDVTLGGFVDPYGFFTLSGSIKGDLESSFSVVKPLAGVMNGSADLKINGTATYVCVADLVYLFTGPYLPISACQAGLGKLGHPTLNVVDTGHFEIDNTIGVFGDIEESDGKLTVTINPSFGIFTLGITKGKLNRD